MSFSKTLERGLPKLDNLRVGVWTALIWMLWLGPLVLLDPILSLPVDCLPLKNFLSWAKSDSFWTPNLCNSSKFLIPRSQSFLENIGTQPSITIVNWSDSVGRCFIRDNFPLHLMRYSEKDSLNFCLTFCRSLRDISMRVFNPYCLINASHSSFRSFCADDSKL